MACLVSVNVGRSREVSSRRGRPLRSAIFKAPVEGRVRVEGVNLAGDDEADRSVHGGPEKAVYAYAREDIDIRFNDLRMVKAFARASRPGAYLRIIQEGDLEVGDEIAILSRPDHAVTLSIASDAVLKDRSLAGAVLAVPGLSRELQRELLEDAA